MDDETPQLEYVGEPPPEERIAGLKQIIERLRQQLEYQVRQNDDLRGILRQKEEPLYAYIKAGPAFMSTTGLELENGELKEQVARLKTSVDHWRGEAERAAKQLRDAQKESARCLLEMKRRDNAASYAPEPLVEMRGENALLQREVANLRLALEASDKRETEMQQETYQLKRAARLRELEVGDMRAAISPPERPDPFVAQAELDFVIQENSLLRRELVRLQDGMRRAGFPVDERGLPMLVDKDPPPSRVKPYNTKEELSTILTTRDTVEPEELDTVPSRPDDPPNRPIRDGASGAGTARGGPSGSATDRTGATTARSAGDGAEQDRISRENPSLEKGVLSAEAGDVVLEPYPDIFVSPGEDELEIEAYVADEPARQELSLRLAEMDEAMAKLQSNLGSTMEDDEAGTVMM